MSKWLIKVRSILFIAETVAPLVAMNSYHIQLYCWLGTEEERRVVIWNCLLSTR
jgi:hypothetical protein